MIPPEPHIPLVDDARDIREPLAADAAAARRAMSDAAGDLALVDIMMPDANGLSLTCRPADRCGPPAILLTAMAEEADRVLGLEFGADA